MAHRPERACALGYRPAQTFGSTTTSAKKPGRNQPPVPTTRRQRREALRAEQARSGAKRGAAGQPAWRSPTALVTIGAVVVALAAILVLNLPRGASGDTGSASPSPATSAGTGTSAGPSGVASAGSGSAAPGSAAPLPSVTVPTPIAAGIPRDGQTLGSSTAPVSLETWEDFQCPACGNFSRTVAPVIIERYVATGKVKLTFHDLAFLGQESLDAASAARCAEQQGKFWEYQTLVFANQNGENQGWFTRDRLEAFAAAAGLDAAAWAACYDGGSQRQAVIDATTAGQKAGIQSTPSLAINGQMVSLANFTSWSDLLTLLDKTIAASGSSGSPASSSSTAP
jgi:protein-disulfide isomerase